MPTPLSKTEKARIDLWTSRDMSFVIKGRKKVGTIPKYTKCEKVPYTRAIVEYLDRMERTAFYRPDGDPKAVCVMLMGMLRYVWRTDVLTKEERDNVTKQSRGKSLRILRQKSRGVVGKGSSE